VGDRFGVGLRREHVTVALELFAKLDEVLDDAVVDQGDAAGAVAVRMGVGVGGSAVRRPARVPDPRRAGDVVERKLLLEDLELPGLPHDVDAAVDDGDTGRVVPAVLEPRQPVHQDGKRLLAADVTDDAAHGVRPVYRP
jgi:hypothetical protein